jgi:hypothetical protein
MKISFIEKLLNQDENSSLDFKRDQYPFDKATEIQKSELLKDILAFANVVKGKNAYILIGVEEVKGGRSKVVGVTQHLDDARLHQFVNSKTNRPVNFSYIAIQFENEQIGIIEITPQIKSPLFPKNDYGRLKKNAVFVRRGSSTDELSPDEILEIFCLQAKQKLESPKLQIQFTNPNLRTLLGDNVETSFVLNKQIESLLRAKESLIRLPFQGSSPDSLLGLLAGGLSAEILGLVVKNDSPNLAKNVRIELKAKCDDSVIVLDKKDFWASGVGKPKRKLLTDFHIVKDISYLTISTKIGNIQPKAEVWSASDFYIYSSKPHKLEFEALIFADNLPQPFSSTLLINIKIEKGN